MKSVGEQELIYKREFRTFKDIVDAIEVINTRLDIMKVVAFGGAQTAFRVDRKVMKLEKEVEEIKKLLTEILKSVKNTS